MVFLQHLLDIGPSCGGSGQEGHSFCVCLEGRDLGRVLAADAERTDLAGRIRPPLNRGRRWGRNHFFDRRVIGREEVQGNGGAARPIATEF